MDNDSIIELSKYDSGSVQFCTDCKHYSVVFGNVVLNFNFEELYNFKKMLDNIKKPNFNVEINQEMRTVIFARPTTIGFSLNENEVILVNKMVHEALIIGEVKDLISG